MKEVEAPILISAATGTKMEETSLNFYEHFLEQDNGAGASNNLQVVENGSQ